MEPLGSQCADRRPGVASPCGVEAGGRLVEEHHLGTVDQAGDEVEPAAHAAGVRLRRLRCGVPQPRLLDQPAARLLACAPRQPQQATDHRQVLTTGQVLIDRGVLTGAAPSEQGWVEIKHLVAAGLLPPGTRLLPRPGRWQSTAAVVRADGMLDVSGQTFHIPSGGGGHVKGAVTDGWTFWRLEDGRKLADVRAVYRGETPTPASAKSFDSSHLHAILETLPEGHWTTYGDLADADAVGTGPQPLGNHITGCAHCVNAHRVLTSDGRVADNFSWGDPDDHRDPAQLLRDEACPSPTAEPTPEVAEQRRPHRLAILT